ncbi:MAG: glycosyltransferase [Candidatus Marsarchaeota archaeon]|nr:glycosyltransferase [Candidatus Marsarchaeota archaeon]
MTIGGLMVTLYVVLSAVMSAQSVFRLYMMLYGWREPDQLLEAQSRKHYAPPQKSFTVLLPARHEERVIQQTIARIYNSNYPKELLDIIVICESGDTGTIEKVNEKIGQLGAPGNVRLEVFDDRPINKPHGLNKGLQAAKHEIVVVFDAEDEPHPDIFLAANSVFSGSDTRVLQSGVQLMDYDNHWFSVLNVLEYFFWFKSSLHFFHRLGFVPLGGNTIFLYREDLVRMGGWDEKCLTEDADLGVRVCRARLPLRIIYDDAMVTKEETPINTAAFVRQRTRWCQGFLQIFLKGEWLQLPSPVSKMLAIYVFVFPLVQTLFVAMLPVSLYMAAVKLPVPLAMFLYIPLYLLFIQSVMQVSGLYEFTQVHGFKIPIRSAMVSLVTFLPYQWLLGYAAARAFYREAKGQTNWEKTGHVGAHRREEPKAVVMPVAPLREFRAKPEGVEDILASNPEHLEPGESLWH